MILNKREQKNIPIKFKYWAYIHINGTLQVKKYFGQYQIDNAIESSFVVKIFPTLEAETIEIAKEIYLNKLKQTNE
jgi:hypothetical protein